eukprot:s274_g4.t8
MAGSLLPKEAQLAEQQENRNKEMQAAQERLTEHEAMCAASKVNASQLEKQNEGLKKTQTTLQNDLQGILKKFDEFSTQVTGSNKRHSECKEEIDSLQSHMEDLEKENVDLRNSARLSELSSEQQVMQKQRDALEKLKAQMPLRRTSVSSSSFQKSGEMIMALRQADCHGSYVLRDSQAKLPPAEACSIRCASFPVTMGQGALALLFWVAGSLSRCSGSQSVEEDDQACFSFFAWNCNWFQHAPEGLSDQEDSACAASGQAFPPWPGATWTLVRDQMWRCVAAFFEGQYLQITLDVEEFWAGWGRAGPPPLMADSFGLCIPRRVCSEELVKWLLLPVYSLYVQTGDPAFVDHEGILSEATVLQSFRDEPPGSITIRSGVELEETIHNLATKELEAALPTPFTHVTGAACIVGHLRTLGNPLVYQNLRQNALDSLHFSELRTILVTEFGNSVPENVSASLAEELRSKNPTRSWREVAHALEAIAPDVILNVAVAEEGDPPDRKCSDTYPRSCNAQWKRLELCMAQVLTMEQQRGKPFDWVIRLRPDMHFSVPLGDIRIYDPDHVHLPVGSWTDPHDTFALLPRRFAPIYFSTRQYGGTEYCWVSPREVRSDDCCHRLKLQLEKHQVPVKRYAHELVSSRYLVRPDTFVEPTEWRVGRDERKRSLAYFWVSLGVLSSRPTFE